MWSSYFCVVVSGFQPTDDISSIDGITACFVAMVTIILVSEWLKMLLKHGSILKCVCVEIWKTLSLQMLHF